MEKSHISMYLPSLRVLFCQEPPVGHIIFLKGLIDLAAAFESSEPLYLFRLNGHVCAILTQSLYRLSDEESSYAWVTKQLRCFCTKSLLTCSENIQSFSCFEYSYILSITDSHIISYYLCCIQAGDRQLLPPRYMHNNH